MTIINILKDGTVVDDMSKVTVPKEVTERIMVILQRSERKSGENKKKHFEMDN